MSPVDEKPAQAVSSPIINSRKHVMLCRTVIAGWTTGALAAVGLMDAGSGGNSSTGGASKIVITSAVKAIGMDDHALANLPASVTGKTSANTDTNCNFSVASVTTSYDITVVDAANTRALISQGLSRQDPARTRFGFTPGTVYSSRSTTAPADGKAEPAGFNNPTIINCAGGSAC